MLPVTKTLCVFVKGSRWRCVAGGSRFVRPNGSGSEWDHLYPILAILVKQWLKITFRSDQQHCGRSSLASYQACPMPDLTPREAHLLEAITSHIKRTGLVPSRAELRIAMGWKSPNTVQNYLRRLRSKGAIDIVRGAARSIRVVSHEAPPDRIPIIDRLPSSTRPISDKVAKRAISAEAVITLFGTRPDFFLRIQGESAIEIGLHDGDLVAVRHASDAREGEIVVVSVDNQAATKVLRLDKGRDTHVPDTANDTVEPGHKKLDIRGVVLASLRSHGRN